MDQSHSHHPQRVPPKRTVSTMDQLREKVKSTLTNNQRVSRAKILSLKRIKLELELDAEDEAARLFAVAATAETNGYGQDQAGDGDGQAWQDTSIHAHAQEGSSSHPSTAGTDSEADAEPHGQVSWMDAGNSSPAALLNNPVQVKRIVHELLREVTSKGAARRHSGLRQLRRLLSCVRKYPLATDAFVATPHAMATLIDLLMGHNSDDQIEAAWCILNLAAGSPAHTAAAAHASPYLVSLLSSPVPLLQETSAWALGNFAGDSVQFRDVVAAQGAIIPLVRILMQSVDPALVKAASFALGNLARGAHAPIALMVEAQIIPALIRQLQYWQQQPGGLAVFCQIAWILTYLSAVDSLRHVLLPLNVLPLMAAGVFLVFDAVFTSEQHSGKPCEVSLNDATPLLRVMGNFATMDNDNVTNAIMSSHASWLDLLVLVMSTEHSGHLIAETAWLLGNLTTSNATGVVDSLVAAGFIPLLLEQLKRPKVPHEVARALCNIACCKPEYLATMLGSSALQYFTACLESPDLQLVCRAIDFFDILCGTDQLDGCELVRQSPAAALIEGLQNHPNARIGQLTEALYLNFLEPKEAEYDDDDHDDHDDDDR